MALFGAKNKPERTEAFATAEKVLEQTEAICNCVLQYVDGTSDAEQVMISDAHEKLGNASSLKESLYNGTLDPQMCTTLGFSLTFAQLVLIVTKLDGSTPEETELIDIAKQQLALAVQAGYAPAVEIVERGLIEL